MSAPLGEVPDEERVEDLPQDMEGLNLNNVSNPSRFSVFKSPPKVAMREREQNNPSTSNSELSATTSGINYHNLKSPNVQGINEQFDSIRANEEPKPQRILKRKRNQSAEVNNTSSSDSIDSVRVKPADKKQKPLNADSHTKHVSFQLQNSSDDPQGVVEAPTEDYQVIPEAAPIWRSSLTHRTHENRANLRSAMYKEFIEDEISPMWTYGVERVPDYFKPLSATMLAKFHSNAKALTQLAYMELLSKSTTEKQLANNHESITKTLYAEANNPDYNKAMNRSAGILTAYRAQEIRKITAYKARETTNRPTTDKEWRETLESRPRPASQDRSRAPNRGGGNKHRRSNTISPTTTRGPSPGPSHRGRGRGRGRGANRGGDRNSNVRANNNREAALFSALRAFMK